MESIWFSSLLYWLFALMVLFPPVEMSSAGLTVECLLRSWLGSEMTSFVQYHMRRTCANLLVHLLLLPGYMVMLMKVEPWFLRWLDTQIHPEASLLLFLLSLLPVSLAALLVLHWWRDGWHQHPVSRTLAHYAQGEPSPRAWVTVATDINIEFRRIDKFTTKANSVYRIIATDSWLMLLTAYRMHVLHQRDAVLSLEGSSIHLQAQNTPIDTQLLQIKVTSVREGIKPFFIRLSSLEYSDLERKIINPVVNARQIVVERSLSDRFLKAFEDTVSLNPKVAYTGELSMCIGCMEVEANVKLERRCNSAQEGREGRCVACYCRPMWCLSCLSKWFAARQDQNHPESWLSSRAPCPTCRSTFCLLDVCLILPH